MQQLRKRVLLDGKFRILTLYKYCPVKWGTQAGHIVYFTEIPGVGKRIKAYKDDDFYNSYDVIVWKMADGIIYVDLI